MTAPELITVIAAFGGLATIVGGVIVNIIKATRMERKMDTVAFRQHEIGTKVAVIDGHVNSAATEYKTKIEAMTKEIADLNRQLSDNRVVAATLAQAKADADIIKPIAATVELVTPPKVIIPE
jgi:hypothetical protein